MKYRLEWIEPDQAIAGVWRWECFDAAASARVAAVTISERIHSPRLRVVVFDAVPARDGGMLDVEESFPDLAALIAWSPPARLPPSAEAKKLAPGVDRASHLRERFFCSISAIGDWAVLNGLLDEQEASILCGTVAVLMEP